MNGELKWILDVIYYPEIKEAYMKFNTALRNGEIIRQPCSVCGKKYRVHGHHPDYSKPLDVIWLCRKHHKQIHLARSWERRR